MPQIYRKLEWLDKEDIIKRMVSLEFNRMIDYYKDADEIETIDEKSSRKDREGGRKRKAEDGFVRFFINFGKTDGLYTNQLIELVNKCVPGKVRIGRIDLMEKFSFFEVEEKEARRVEKCMNNFEVDGRRVIVEEAQEKGEGKGKEKERKRRSTAQKRFERANGKPGKHSFGEKKRKKK